MQYGFESVRVESGLGYATFVAALMTRSDLHRRWSVDDFVRLICPPLRLGQGKVFIENQRVIGFVSWAYLSVEAEDAFLTGRRKLQPADWNSGNRLWFIDFIAPHGHARRIVEYGYDHGFPQGTGRFVRRRPDGSIRCIRPLRQPRAARNIELAAADV